MAGVEGVEPSHTAPETAVLPLDDTPTTFLCTRQIHAQAQVDILEKDPTSVKRFFSFPGKF